MSNSDERREVAARLRDEGYELSEIDAGVELASLALEDALGVDHMRGWCDEFDRLADLIDPTCEMVPATRHPYGDYANCRCSACGYDGAFEPLVRPVDGYPVPDERMWRYCPHCGARVVNNGE